MGQGGRSLHILMVAVLWPIYSFSHYHRTIYDRYHSVIGSMFIILIILCTTSVPVTSYGETVTTLLLATTTMDMYISRFLLWDEDYFLSMGQRLDLLLCLIHVLMHTTGHRNSLKFLLCISYMSYMYMCIYICVYMVAIIFDNILQYSFVAYTLKYKFIHPLLRVAKWVKHGWLCVAGLMLLSAVDGMGAIAKM